MQVGHERADVPERTCLGQMTDVLRHRGVPSLGVVQVDRDHAALARIRSGLGLRLGLGLGLGLSSGVGLGVGLGPGSVSAAVAG